MLLVPSIVELLFYHRCFFASGHASLVLVEQVMCDSLGDSVQVHS